MVARATAAVSGTSALRCCADGQSARCRGAPVYEKATGLNPQVYLARWLAITAGLFLISAIAYAIRLAIYDPCMKGWLAWAAAGAVAVACTSGCGGGQDPPPTACSDGARTVLGALQRAPGDVSLEGGTLISTCVRRSLDTGQIQTLGFTYLGAANSELQLMPHSDPPPSSSGSWSGRCGGGEQDQRGAARALRRLDQVAGVGGPPGPRHAAYRRGMAAGEDHG